MVARIAPNGERLKVSWRLGLATAFIVAQFVMIFVGLGLDNRFYTWAPHDQQARYEIAVTLDGRELTDREVNIRYGRSNGIDPRAAAHVLNIVEQFETTYGSEDNAQVVVRYWINGGEEQVWEWPR